MDEADLVVDTVLVDNDIDGFAVAVERVEARGCTIFGVVDYIVISLIGLALVRRFGSVITLDEELNFAMGLARATRRSDVLGGDSSGK